MTVAWVRVDDGFTHHPKIVKLSRADRWTWLEVLCYTARFRTEGVVPTAVGEVVRRATPTFLKRCHEAGLLDLEDGSYHVHDWNDYNGRDPKVLQAERQRRRRDKGVTSAVTETEERRDENVTRAQARARVPQPQPLEEPLAKDVTGSKDVTEGSSAPAPRNELWDALAEVFGEPSTKQAATLRGRICRTLKQAGATPDEIHRRARSWPRHFDTATLTETALEKHWDRLGRSPLRAGV